MDHNPNCKTCVHFVSRVEISHVLHVNIEQMRVDEFNFSNAKFSLGALTATESKYFTAAYLLLKIITRKGRFSSYLLSGEVLNILTIRFE